MFLFEKMDISLPTIFFPEWQEHCDTPPSDAPTLNFYAPGFSGILCTE